MIDWLNVLYHACWVVGLAIIFATFSYHDWQAARQQLRLRHVLDRPSFQLAFFCGSFMVTLGLLLLATVWWERLIWLLFLSYFGYQVWLFRKLSP